MTHAAGYVTSFQTRQTIKKQAVTKRLTRQYQITVSDIAIDVVHKRIKNINLAVYSQDDRVRISAPLQVSGETVREFALSRVHWIKDKQAQYQEQNRLTQRQYLSGEQHYLFGQPYALNIIAHNGAGEVSIRDEAVIELRLKPSTDFAYRQKVIRDWYRGQLQQRVPDLVEKWQLVMGVKVNEWRIKQMKTRWGSCNINAGRICLNLELAKKPPNCLEYIVVHEMVHLLERRHNDRFRGFMDKFLPDWRMHEGELKLPH